MRIEIKEKDIFSNLIIEKYSYSLSADSINGVSIDSRKTKKNNIFFGIKGKNFDGNKFINQALNNGASTVINQNKLTKYDIDLVVYVGLFVEMCFELKQMGYLDQQLQEYLTHQNRHLLTSQFDQRLYLDQFCF